MTKAELVQRAANATGLSKRQTEGVVDALVSNITDTLVSGGKFTLPGVGTFSVKQKNARTSRNPRTGETIDVPAKLAAKFSAAKALKDALN